MPIPQVPSPLTAILATGTYDSNWFPGATIEAQIQAAINAAAADGAPRVLVHSAYNASLITFNSSVQMVREGGDWSVFDVKAYGAAGDGVTDDTGAIQAAITAATAGAVAGAGLGDGLGGIVFFPSGVYRVSNLTAIAPVSFVGTNPRTSVLKGLVGATGYMLTIDGFNASAALHKEFHLSGIRVVNLGFDGNVRQANYGSLYLAAVEHSTFACLAIESFSKEAINCFSSVRECHFDQIHTRFCGDKDLDIPCVSLFDQHAVSGERDAHNLNIFTKCFFVYSYGDGVLLETLAGRAALTRDQIFKGCVWHGLIPSAVTPTTPTAGQQACTHVEMRSATGIHADSCVMIAAGTGANFFHEKAGLHATAPSSLVITDVFMSGRYANTGTRYSVWIEAGDVHMEQCIMLASDTNNVRTESGTSPYYGLTNHAPAGNSLAGSSVPTTNPMQTTWAAQQGISYAADDATFFLKSLNTGGRQYNFVSGANASGNVPGGAGGHYLYDLTGGARRYYILPNGHFHHDQGVSSGIIAPSEAVLVSGVDVSAGNWIGVTLTAARVVGAPLNPTAGQRITYRFIQDGTGGWAVTWNAVFKISWSDTGNTLNKRSSISFIYDGTNWNQDGAQTPYI